TRLCRADVHSDGRVALAATNVDSAAVVRLGGGDGTFGTQAPGPSLPTRIFNFAAADYNGDGNDDLAMTTFDTQGHGSADVRLGGGTPTLSGNLLVNGGFEGAG